MTRADRAVVLGGSVTGLLAARVLTEHYRQVTVVDRDRLDPGRTGARRGVPHGRHVHGLLARGQQILEQLFPGFTAELARAGVPTGDLGRIRWYFDGRRLNPADTGLTCVSALRPDLEGHLRARVAALPGVSIMDGHDVLRLGTTANRRRVVGAVVRRRDAGAAEELLEADLVVDATGRGSRTPGWLEELGYRRPPEDRVKIGLTYSSRQYRIGSYDVIRDDLSINPVATPAHPRGAFCTRVDGGRLIVSLTGVLGDRPPSDPDGFLAYARSLPVRDVFEVISAAEPLGDAVSFHFPASVRRRYERLTDVPDGLVVMGDALCSFNPVYGQGMTVAALEALELRRHLEAPGGLRPRRFFRDVARVIDAPWDMSASGDLGFAGVAGRRTPRVRLANAYLRRVQAAAARDPAVTAAFMRVAGLVDAPGALLRPRLVARVLRPTGRFARRADPAGGPPGPTDHRDPTVSTSNGKEQR